MSKQCPSVDVAWTDADEAPRKRVGIWIRVSTEDQAQGESPEHHEKRARYYAEAKGWEVVRLYDLSAVSGKAVMGHPQAEAMLDDIRAGRISGLIFSKLARLARNTKELLEFADYFQRYSADLISLAESIDTSTPAGRFFYTMIAAMAQWEREEIADRVKASVEVRAKLGKPLGGAAPYGYQWQDGELILEPDEAPIRRQMFELFLTHRRLKTVARTLTDAGHRTRRGANWSDSSVRRLLLDPIAKGKRRVNYTRSTGEGKRWEFKPQDDWVWIDVPAIVSEELWAEVVDILETRKRERSRRPGKKVVYLFSGLTYCACGGTMYVPTGSKKYVCGDCRNKIPIDALENVFQAKLSAFLASPDEVSEALSESDRVLAEKRELLEALNRERSRVATEMNKLYRLYLDDELSSQGFGKRNRPLEERLEGLSDEIPRLEAEIDVMTVRHLSSAEIVSEAQDLYARWYDLSFDERRSIVETIVDRITVGEDEISIDLISPTGMVDTEPHKGGEKLTPLPPASVCPGIHQTVANRQHNLRDSSTPTARSAPGSRSGRGFGQPSPRLLPMAAAELRGRRVGIRAARRGTAHRHGRG